MMYMHHDSPPSRDAPCVCTALRKATRAIGQRYDQALADHGMTIGQFAILRHIKRGAPIALSRLADQLVMDRTSLYRGVEPMAKAGWIALEAAPRGKTKLASLTALGLEHVAAAEPVWRAVQAEVTQALGGNDIADIQTGLARLTAFAQEAAA